MTGNLDVLAARAQAAFPQGTIGYFLYTPRTDRPLAVRMRLPDDPHPNGRSTVWLDPRSGMVLAAQRWNELDPGTRVNSYIYPLHTGELGGPPWQAGVAILGLDTGRAGDQRHLAVVAPPRGASTCPPLSRTGGMESKIMPRRHRDGRPPPRRNLHCARGTSWV